MRRVVKIATAKAGRFGEIWAMRVGGTSEATGQLAATARISRTNGCDIIRLGCAMAGINSWDCSFSGPLIYGHGPLAVKARVGRGLRANVFCKEGDERFTWVIGGALAERRAGWVA